MNLLTALTTGNTTGTTGWGGGRGFLYAAGTWNGATVTLAWSPTAAGTFVAIQSGVSLTANGSVALEIGQGFLKATLAGGDGSTTVSWGVDITTVTQH